MHTGCCFSSSSTGVLLLLDGALVVGLLDGWSVGCWFSSNLLLRHQLWEDHWGRRGTDSARNLLGWCVREPVRLCEQLPRFFRVRSCPGPMCELELETRLFRKASQVESGLRRMRRWGSSQKVTVLLMSH